MITVGAYEAKTRLSALLERVIEGEQVTITKHHVPVARLIPAGDAKERPVADVVAALREFRLGKSLGGNTIRELIEEGRR